MVQFPEPTSSIENRDSLIVKVDEILSLLDQLNHDEDEALREKGLILETGLRLAKTRLKRCIPELLVEPTRATLDQLFTQITAELNAFYTNSNAGHVTNASIKNLPSLLAGINLLQVPNTVNEVESYADAVALQIQSLRSLVSSFRDTVAKQQAGLDSNYTELVSKNTVLGNELAAMKSSIEAAKTTLQATLEEERVRLATISTEFQNEFKDGEKERATSSLEAIQKFKNESEESIRQATTTLDDFITNKGQKLIDEIVKQKDAAKELVHLIAGSGMSDGFTSVADDEEGKADQLRCIAILAWVVVVIAVFIVITSMDGELTVGRVLGKVLSLAIISAPATYLSVESRGHRLEARRARRYALELVALDAYLAPLDESVRKEKINELTSSYFGRVDTQPSTKKECATIQEQIMEAVNEALRKIKK